MQIRKKIQSYYSLVGGKLLGHGHYNCVIRSDETQLLYRVSIIPSEGSESFKAILRSRDQDPVLQDTTRFVFDQPSIKYTSDEFLTLHVDIVQDYLGCLNGQDLSETIYVSRISTELVPLSLKNNLNIAQRDHLRRSVNLLHERGIVHTDLHM